MQQGVIAGYPLKGIRVRLFDGSYHTVDSSEMAFKIAGSMAMKEAVSNAGPVLLEPIMLVTASVPDSAVGDVMGDLSSRRGRPLGTENVGGMTEVKAEVPMAEVLTYAPDLRSITGGQGEYTLEFVRYEEVPSPPRAKDRAEARGGGRSGQERSAARCYARHAVASTRDIRTNQLDISCDVCGRTLLRGERAESYLAGGERRQVCELCTVRAQHEGWIREDGGDELTLRTSRTERGRGFLEKLRVAPRARARGGRRGRGRGGGGLRRDARARRRGTAAPPPDLPRRPRHVRAVPTNAELKVERALEVFNASEHTRTVGGIARSLGAPAVSARPLPDRPSVVGIAVMWELSWYRFEIDLSDEAGGVRQIAQGAELSELDADEQVVERRGGRAGRTAPRRRRMTTQRMVE